jgi:hypothetical protein
MTWINELYSRWEQIELFEKSKSRKPQRGDINTAWGSAPGNPSYAHVESMSVSTANYADKRIVGQYNETQWWRNANYANKRHKRTGNDAD